MKTRKTSLPLGVVGLASLLMPLLLTLPTVAQAQFDYGINNDGTITIAGYSGPGGAVTIPETSNGLPVASIDPGAFEECTSLTSVMIPNSVTSIGNNAFYGCSSLRGVFFEGRAPSLIGLIADVFSGANTTVYYLPGTGDWGATFGGLPTALWKPEVQTSDASFGVQTNRFGFAITWASDKVVVVEANTNLSNASWTPVQIKTLTHGLSYFSDPQWTNYPGRFYRLRSP